MIDIFVVPEYSIFGWILILITAILEIYTHTQTVDEADQESNIYKLNSQTTTKPK